MGEILIFNFFNYPYFTKAFQVDSLSANHFLAASWCVIPSTSTKAAIAPI